MIKRKEHISAEAYIPIVRVNENIVPLKDGSLVGYIYIYPKDINLSKQSEKESIVKSYSNIFKSLPSDLQTINVASGTKVEGHLDYLKGLREKEQDLMKRKILSQDMVNAVKSSLITVERNAYIILKESSEKALIERLKSVGQQLQNTGLQMRLCNVKEIKQLLFAYYNPEFTGNIKEVYV